MNARPPATTTTDASVGAECWSRRDRRPWRPPAVRTVVVSPHPDDEALAAGGLIAHQRRAGVDVEVVAVTDGERAYPWLDPEALAAVRRDEQRRALTHLGVDEHATHRLGLPDGGVAAVEPSLAARLARIVRPGDLVVAPWEHDWHPDHEACGRAARAVARVSGCRLVGTVFWALHHVDPRPHEPLDLLGLVLDDDLLRARSTAVGCHRSQLAPVDGEPILPAELLGHLALACETYVRVRP